MSTTKRRLEKEEKERTKQKMHKATGRVAKIVVKGPPPNPKPNCILVIPDPECLFAAFFESHPFTLFKVQTSQASLLGLPSDRGFETFSQHEVFRGLSSSPPRSALGAHNICKPPGPPLQCCTCALPLRLNLKCCMQSKPSSSKTCIGGLLHLSS